MCVRSADARALMRTREFVPLKIAVLTVSDTRNLKDDKSGALLVQRIVAAGHLVTERSIVPDDIEAIRTRVKAWIADPSVDVIITTGRHRLYRPRRDAGSDRAAVREKDGRVLGAVSGGELSEDRHLGDSVARHRRASPARPTSSACRARRAPAGMPGTKFWCTSSIIAIEPCNFVEIMPRLDEHLRRPKAKGATA